MFGGWLILLPSFLRLRDDLIVVWWTSPRRSSWAICGLLGAFQEGCFVVWWVVGPFAKDLAKQRPWQVVLLGPLTKERAKELPWQVVLLGPTKERAKELTWKGKGAKGGRREPSGSADWKRQVLAAISFPRRRFLPLPALASYSTLKDTSRRCLA